MFLAPELRGVGTAICSILRCTVAAEIVSKAGQADKKWLVRFKVRTMPTMVGMRDRTVGPWSLLTPIESTWSASIGIPSLSDNTAS